MSQADIALELPAMRVSYEEGVLDEGSLQRSWHEQLQAWLDEATRASLPEPNAMVLATADPEGRPSSRTVLCKGLDERGVVFYTNYTSNKSHDLISDPLRVRDLPVVRACSARRTCAASWRRSARPRPRPTGQQAARFAAGCVGLAAVEAGQRALYFGQCAGQHQPPVRRRRVDPGPAALGRLADPAADGRVLAGPPGPHARPAGVRAHRRRLESTPPRSLITPGQRSETGPGAVIIAPARRIVGQIPTGSLASLK